jgi:hypothetical protein
LFDIIAEIASVYGALILAILGVAVSFISDSTRSKMRWFFLIAFCIIGLVTSTANYFELHSSNISNKRLLDVETGGDNVCYIDTADTFNSKGERITSSAIIVNKGGTPCYDVNIDIIASTKGHQMRL